MAGEGPAPVFLSAQTAQEFLDDLRKPLGEGSRLSALRDGVFVCVDTHFCDPKYWHLQSADAAWTRSATDDAHLPHGHVLPNPAMELRSAIKGGRKVRKAPFGRKAALWPRRQWDCGRYAKTM